MGAAQNTECCDGNRSASINFCESTKVRQLKKRIRQLEEEKQEEEDTNKDGVVDEAEFAAAGGSKEEFDKYDLNGDGVLDAEEPAVRAAAKEKGASDLNGMDTNKDGVVDEAEFAAAGGTKEDIICPGDPNLGVSVHHLHTEFLDLLKNHGLAEDARVFDVESIIRGVGEAKLCPRDERRGAAYVDAIPSHAVGQATFYLTYTWSYFFRDIVYSLLRHCQNNSLDPKRTYIWICCLCINLHRSQEKAANGVALDPEEYGVEFKTRIQSIGKHLHVESSIRQLAVCQRIWVLLDFHNAVETGVPSDVIFAPSAVDDMKSVFQEEGIAGVVQALDRIDASSAEASDPAYQNRIFEIIEAGLGFEFLAQKIKSGFLSFFKQDFHSWVDEQLAVACAPKDPTQRARWHSERLGISVHYILNHFTPEARAATDQEDAQFEALAAKLCYGPDAIGYNKMCPRDQRPHCSYVDALADTEHVAQATHFVSWTWRYPLSTFVGALSHWVKTSGLNPRKIFVWVCFFCNNQFRILEERSAAGSDDLDRIFEGRLKDIGAAVAILDGWENPVYLTRVWTIFEQFVAAKNNIPMEMVMPPDVASKFNETIRTSGLEGIQQSLGMVDAEKATAWSKVDEDTVKDKIRASVGFKVVNSTVRQRLGKWCGSQVGVVLADN